jgi:alanine dehydrogenase
VVAGAAILNVPPPVLLFDHSTVAELLTLEACIAAVEKAFRAYATGDILSPGLLHVAAEGGEFHIKVGGLKDIKSYLTTKVGGGFFNNRRDFDLPNIIGLILLADGSTGAPLAVMESGLITRFRAGAATAVAARYLARQNSKTVTVCGAGVQAEIQLRSLMKVLPLERAFLWNRGDATTVARRLAEELELQVTAEPELARATLKSDVIVTRTPAKHWFLGKDHVRAGTFIAAVGADSPDKQEIQPELLAQASVVCDLVEQGAHVGDLHHAIAEGLMTCKSIRGELGNIVAGTSPKRIRDDEIIIFDSTGTALQDVAAASAVYEKAILLARGQAFGFWD